MGRWLVLFSTGPAGGEAEGGDARGGGAGGEGGGAEEVGMAVAVAVAVACCTDDRALTIGHGCQPKNKNPQLDPSLEKRGVFFAVWQGMLGLKSLLPTNGFSLLNH